MIADGLHSTKQCVSCGVYKKILEYPPDNRSKTGISRKCKDCRKSFLEERMISKGYNEDKIKHRLGNMNNSGLIIRPLSEELSEKTPISVISLTIQTDVEEFARKVYEVLTRDFPKTSIVVGVGKSFKLDIQDRNGLPFRKPTQLELDFIKSAITFTQARQKYVNSLVRS